MTDAFQTKWFTLLLRGMFCARVHGSLWAKHVDAAGIIQGWEERGPNWRGFSTGGNKTLFRFGSGLRFCVTESAIDALSLAALEGIRADTCYVSTGGGWSPRAIDLLKTLLKRPGATAVAATDDDQQGDTYASRLAAIAEKSACPALACDHRMAIGTTAS